MKVLVSDNLSKQGVEILQKESGIEVDVKTGMSKEELIKVIPEYDGLIVRSATKVTPEVIEAASKLKVVGRAGVGVDKWEHKTYYSHSGYPGGLKQIKARELLGKHPEQLMKLAVKGMLPKNKLGRKMFKKLKVYAGSDHPHQAQKPEPLVLGEN